MYIAYINIGPKKKPPNPVIPKKKMERLKFDNYFMDNFIKIFFIILIHKLIKQI